MKIRQIKKNKFFSGEKSVSAPIYEIFCSYQGEGARAGEKQIFLRFSGCNLACPYCDEPAAFKKGKTFSLPEAAANIKRMSALKKTKIISLTGGEPLLYPDFILGLSALLVPLGFSFFLETNGTLPAALKKVVNFMDLVSMDIKIPSLGGRVLWKEHREFLKTAAGKVYLKTIVSSNTSVAEFAKAVALAASLAPEALFFIQPESSEFFSGRKGNPFLPYEKFLKAASRRLKNVRILPQLHKLLGVK